MLVVVRFTPFSLKKALVVGFVYAAITLVHPVPIVVEYIMLSNTLYFFKDPSVYSSKRVFPLSSLIYMRIPAI